MLLLGTKNTTTQTVPAGSVVALGSAYRRYCKKNNCGIRAFSIENDSIVLQHSGMYKVHATVTFTGDAAGDVTLQLTQGGVPIPGAIATATVTTADTEVNTLSIDYFVLVDNVCLLGNSTTIGQAVNVTNTGETDITVTNYVLNVTKVV